MSRSLKAITAVKELCVGGRCDDLSVPFSPDGVLSTFSRIPCLYFTPV